MVRGLTTTVIGLCLLPVVLVRCVFPALDWSSRDAQQKWANIMCTSRIPWLKSFSQIPFADGQLHDGPTCDHAALTAEQRKVSLAMCFCSGDVLETLQSLSRDAILSSLLHNDDVILGVEQLPLPAALRKYCLFG